ncbi:DUF6602 domain-containing protein [Ruegeria faecimaris]|uniref:DUF6602 domain-containing protein n=1 Tax=Ruegeria faecimaris TaxID=686389 RepID=UPI00248F59D5|nr:DUF6602 domain-containing protein [Ruegeria faecimaris]
MSSIARFYELEAEKISAEGKKVALFTKHPGTLGTYREALLRQYLSEHIGGDLIVSSGFITSHDPESDEIYARSSRQIDALVYDASATPLLKSTDFVVVEPSSVAAIIEVKSDLTLSKKRKLAEGTKVRFKDDKGEFVWQGTLVDALANLFRSIEVLRDSGVSRDKYFAAIIGYEASSINQFEQAMESGELPEQLGVGALDDLPTNICVFGGKSFQISAYQWTPDTDDPSAGSDPECSFLLESAGSSLGTSLQFFTAELNFVTLVARKEQPHTVGGLRSAMGFQGSVVNHRIPVSSKRQHGIDLE